MLGKAEKINWAPVILKPNVLIFPAVVVIVMVGLGLLVIGPTIRTVMDKREQVRQEQERLEKLVEKREALESLSVEEMTWELAIFKPGVSFPQTNRGDYGVDDGGGHGVWIGIRAV